MKPRVLFVGRSRYRLPLEGSAVRKWDALREVLDVRVLATGADGPDRDDTFHLVRDRPLAPFYALLPLYAAREIREFRPHVLVAQSPYEAVALRPVRDGAKLLLEVHGDWRTATRLYGSRARRLVEPVSLRLARRGVRGADAIRAVSSFTGGLVRAAGAEPTATFTAYYDVSAFVAAPPAPLPERPAALFVGVLERYKNVAGLADAWRLASPRLPGAQLRLVGRGRETAVVETLVADLPESTEWRERLTSEEVAGALDEASLLVLPSFSEGLPRVAMEAFARGRPVVGSRAGGTPDIVEDGVNGVLVDPRDPAAIAEALVRTLGDRALLERLAAGAAASFTQWRQTPEEYARRMRELVDRLL